MTYDIALQFIFGWYKFFTGIIPTIFVVLLILKLLRYASGWQGSEHRHKVFKVQ